MISSRNLTHPMPAAGLAVYHLRLIAPVALAIEADGANSDRMAGLRAGGTTMLEAILNLKLNFSPGRDATVSLRD